MQFDTEKAKEIIGDGSEASYTIPVTITQPTITEAVLKERLFRDTLARTATNLNEGNAPRTNNVRLAAKAINGTILNPGDVFSYNTVVGERTQARGYQEAHAYSGGKIIDEFGGGVCQPSSTLYMAVLRADLEVVERHNHSFTSPTRRSARTRPWTTATLISASRTIPHIPSRSSQSRPTAR